MKCKDCVFLGKEPYWAREDGWNIEGDFDIAECHRFPPTFCKGIMTQDDYGVFPVVFVDEYWCGEWHAKTKERKNSLHSTRRRTLKRSAVR